MPTNFIANRDYPAKRFPGYRLHVFKDGPQDWQVWLNTEVQNFDGLCIGTGPTYGDAVAAAVRCVETVERLLQGPPWIKVTE